MSLTMQDTAHSATKDIASSWKLDLLKHTAPVIPQAFQVGWANPSTAPSSLYHRLCV